MNEPTRLLKMLLLATLGYNTTMFHGGAIDAARGQDNDQRRGAKAGETDRERDFSGTSSREPDRIIDEHSF